MEKKNFQSLIHRRRGRSYNVFLTHFRVLLNGEINEFLIGKLVVMRPDLKCWKYRRKIDIYERNIEKKNLKTIL
jgi:hypothetical protein